MKDLLLKYANYNIWANSRIIEVLQKLTSEQANQTIVSSFSTIKDTVLHIWSAEYVWLDRLILVENPVWLAKEFSGSFNEAIEGWQSASNSLKEYIVAEDENSLRQIIPFKDLAGNEYVMEKNLCLQHVFNHSTFHRGQLITLMRQVGVAELPRTDFIVYIRLLAQ